MRNTIWFLFFSCTSLLVSSCLNTTDICEEDFAFEIFAEASPQTDSVQVGDTLSFVFSIPVNVMNIFDGETVDISAYPFPVGVNFSKITEDQGAPFYEVNISEGDLLIYQELEGQVQLTSGTSFQSEKEGNEQIVEFLIVPQKAGLFAISFGTIGLFQNEPDVLGDPLCEDQVIWIIDGPFPDNYELINDLVFSPEAGGFKDDFQDLPIIAIQVFN